MTTQGPQIRAGKLLVKDGKVPVASTTGGCSDCCACPSSVEISIVGYEAGQCGCTDNAGADTEVTQLQDVDGTYQLDFVSLISGVCKFHLTRASTDWYNGVTYFSGDGSCTTVNSSKNRASDTQYWTVDTWAVDGTILEAGLGGSLNTYGHLHVVDPSPGSAPGLALDSAHANGRACGDGTTLPTNEHTGSDAGTLSLAS